MHNIYLFDSVISNDDFDCDMQEKGRSNSLTDTMERSLIILYYDDSCVCCGHFDYNGNTDVTMVRVFKI